MQGKNKALRVPRVVFELDYGPHEISYHVHRKANRKKPIANHMLYFECIPSTLIWRGVYRSNVASAHDYMGTPFAPVETLYCKSY